MAKKLCSVCHLPGHDRRSHPSILYLRRKHAKAMQAILRKKNPEPKKDRPKIELGGYKAAPKLFKTPKKRHRKAKGKQMGFFDSVFGAHQPSLFG